MPRLPITQRGYETTEEDGSFDSHFTESARSLLASVDAYVASQGSAHEKAIHSAAERGVKPPPNTTLD
jgi:hypothetical protein